MMRIIVGGITFEADTLEEMKDLLACTPVPWFPLTEPGLPPHLPVSAAPTPVLTVVPSEG